MGKFHFSIPGRKKPTSPDAFDNQALSKAHKILGSTPINIDSQAYLNRTSSSAAGDASGEAARHPSLDDAYLDDEHVRLALSEGEWDDDGMPRACAQDPRQDLERPNGGRGHSRLKKSQSSSAIRSKKRLQAAARHCSSQLTGDAPPFRDDDHREELRAASHNNLNHNNHNYQHHHNNNNSISLKAKKKPAMLDLSSLRPNSRLSRSSYQSQPDSASSLFFYHGSHNQNKSNGTVSSLSHSGILGSKRSSLKRRTKESFRSLLSDASGSTSSGGAPREPHTDPGLSTLYNHYEQMSFLQVMKQGRDSDEYHALQQLKLGDAQDEAEWEEAQADRDLDWLHKPLRDPVQITGRKLLAEEPSSPPPPPPPPRAPPYPPAQARKSKGKKLSSKSAGKSSKTSKEPGSNPAKRYSQKSDFHDKSVLLLSDSDSDEVRTSSHAHYANHDAATAEDDPNAGMILLNRTYNAGARTAKQRLSLTRSEESVQGPTRHRSSGSDHYPRRPTNRRTTSENLGGPFAAMNASSATDGASSPIQNYPTYHVRSPSPRESLSSSDSKASMMTCQFGFGGQENPVMTVLPARRPSQAELDQDAARIRASRRSSSRQDQSPQVPRSPEQLTPPLSPSSVDFFMRGSARPSNDAPELPNRIMAVTREEKMLISALRKKNQAMREIARLEASGQLLGHGGSSRLHDFVGGGGSSSSATTAADRSPLLEHGGYPAANLPSIHMQAPRQSDTVSESARDRSSTLGHGRPRGFSYDEAELASPRERQGSAMYQDVLVYLDQRKASFGGASSGGGGGGSIQGDVIGTITDLDRLPMMRSFFDPHTSGHPDDHDHFDDDHDDLQLQHHLHQHQQHHHCRGEEDDDVPRFADAASLRGRFHPGRIQTDNLAGLSLGQTASPSRLETLSEQDLEELPRGESPISPEAFPSVPENRVRSRNRARLSAVGLAIPAHLHEPHWADEE